MLDADRETKRRRSVMAAVMTATWLSSIEGEDLTHAILPGLSEDEIIDKMVLAADFMRLANSGQGEVLYRWMAQAGMHAFPEHGWTETGELVRLWFDCTASILATLRPILDPPEGAPVVTPPAHRPKPSELIGERGGQIGARTYPGMSMAGVVVHRPGAPASTGTVGEMLSAEGRRMPLPTQRGEMPTPEEMAEMSVEERRRYIALDPRFADPAIVTKAPPIDDFERVAVSTAYGPTEILVPRGRDAPQRDQEAGPGAADPAPGLLHSPEGHGEQTLSPPPPNGDAEGGGAGDHQPGVASPPPKRKGPRA
jgi:hypothetical protein